MNTKLTLSIEQSLIKKAKAYAKDNGRSLSDIVENYLKIIVKDDQMSNITPPPISSSLKGAFKSQKGIKKKENLAKALKDKYLTNE